MLRYNTSYFWAKAGPNYPFTQIFVDIFGGIPFNIFDIAMSSPSCKIKKRSYSGFQEQSKQGFWVQTGV